MPRIETLEALADYLDLLAREQLTGAGEKRFAAAGDAYAKAAGLVRAFASEGIVEVELSESKGKRSQPEGEWKMIAGWKVKVTYVETDPEDQRRRGEAILRVLARSLRRRALDSPTSRSS